MISKIKDYKQWLIQQGYSDRSVNRYSDSAMRYSIWLKQQLISFKNKKKLK